MAAVKIQSWLEGKTIRKGIVVPGRLGRDLNVKERSGIRTDQDKIKRAYDTQLLFLIPIFAVFYFWSERSVKKDNRIQSLIASHLLVVAFIPILIKLMKLVVDLIPDHFFNALFRILHLIAIWHYLVILGAVALGLLSISSRKKCSTAKSGFRNGCHHCGVKTANGAGDPG
ncbi:hypothetical protein [Pontiella sp.]|uniref:hypothetical protein n=1 Tax=Pontiella sp. TaxID=2837462 RepID=UPI003565EBAD